MVLPTKLYQPLYHGSPNHELGLPYSNQVKWLGEPLFWLLEPSRFLRVVKRNPELSTTRIMTATATLLKTSFPPFGKEDYKSNEYLPRCNVRSQQPVRQRLVESDNEREVFIPGPGHVERQNTPRAVTTHTAESKPLAYKKRKLSIATIEVVSLPPPCNVPAQMANPTVETPSACMEPIGERYPPANSNQTREFALSSQRRNHQRNERRKITPKFIN